MKGLHGKKKVTRELEPRYDNASINGRITWKKQTMEREELEKYNRNR